MSARQESATERLSRLLVMVPWLLGHQGVDVEAAAAQFGISPAQLEQDLELIFVCGTPGHLPDDLIDAQWEDGQVFLTNADAISRPLRFTVDEALTLMVGLRALADGATPADRNAVLSALDKLEEATGAAAGPADHVRVRLADGADAGYLPELTDAVRRHRRVHLRYGSHGRDSLTDRDVDPMRLVTLEGRWYLEGWCHRAEQVRLFRLDRIDGLTVLDADGTPPEQATPRDLDEAMYRPSASDTRVTVRLQPSATWVADYYLAESTDALPDGGSRAVISASDPAWVRRLALSLGGSLVVEDPVWLARDIADRASAALRAYPETGA